MRFGEKPSEKPQVDHQTFRACRSDACGSRESWGVRKRQAAPGRPLEEVGPARRGGAVEPGEQGAGGCPLLWVLRLASGRSWRPSPIENVARRGCAGVHYSANFRAGRQGGRAVWCL